MSNSPRITRGSLRHLSPDYAWDLLEPTSSQFFAADSTVEEKKGKKDKKGAIPKTRPSGVTPESLPESQFPLGLPEYDPAGTPPCKRDEDEITRLQLLKDNNDREIRKLELRLQLAQLENKIGGATPTSGPEATSNNNKSMGDLKAPQKITHPQQWPHLLNTYTSGCY